MIRAGRSLRRARGARGSSFRSSFLLCALPFFAQGPPADLHAKILAKDDAEFAMALSRFGYTDLAADVLAAIEKGGGKEPLRAAMLRLELDQDRALREPDTAKRIDLLEGLIKTRTEFAEGHPGTPEASQVLESQLELYRSVGELITQVLQEKPASSEAEQLKKRGIELFERAVTALEERLATLSQAPATPPTPEQENETYVARMVTAYGLARTHYFRGLLYDAGSFERTVIIKKALDILLDFQLEYSDQLLCYEGYIYEGLCHRAVGDTERALESFDAAIALRDTYEKTRSGVFQMSSEAADIVSSAVQQRMLLQSATGDHAGAAATAKDFFETTPDPATTMKGLAVLAQQAEAYQALGDQAALAETAKRLIAADPFGPGGQRGRELLGGGAATTLGAIELLKLAESSHGREPDKAIELCQQVMALARGTADQADIGSRAGILLGWLYNQRQLLHESVVVWDTCADRYPDGKEAPECLWRAINGYLTLQGQERRSIYKTLAQERLAELSRRYPQHPYASMAGLIEGRQAEAEEDYARAAQVYERIAPGAAGHEEGLYRAGNAWSQQARKLFGEGKKPEAADAAKRSETLLVKARTELEAAAGRTLETSVQDKLRGLAFSARIALADLYLIEGVNRAAAIGPLFQGLDAELAKDPARMSLVWDRRFRALRAQGKLEEAIGLLDAQIRQDPSADWLQSGTGALAPFLDTRAQDLRKTDPNSAEANRLWGKAASYYLLAIKGQLEGRDSVQVDQLEGVADRLFVFGLHEEGVPDAIETSADWSGKRLTNQLLERAVQAYEAVLPLTPSYRTIIKLARTLGFLGRWEEAAARYAELFERETFVNRVSNTINQDVVSAKPELLFAYVEWGVAEREVGVENNDTSKLLRAARIFEALVNGTAKGSKLWWQAQYRQLQLLIDRGEYDVADVSLDSLQLNYEHFDEGKYGLERRFTELRDQLSKKVFK